MATTSKALQNPTVRKVAKFGIVHVLRGDSKSAPFWMRWGLARAQAARHMKRLVRGTAVVWPESGRAITIGRDLPRPASGQVLIRTLVSAVSPGTERAFFLRMRHTSSSFPSFPGYSLVGEVISAGSDVPYRPGDVVAAPASHASLVLVDADQVYPVPAGVDAETAAFVQLGIIAINALEQARVGAGDTVVVLGHGIIGQLLVQLAKAAGAAPVISVARSDRRVSSALSASAQQVVILERDGSEQLENAGASVVFDATGHPDALSLAALAVREGGEIVIAGSPREASEETDMGALADKRVTLVGAHAGRLLQPGSAEWTARANAYAERFFALAAAGDLEMGSMISDRIHPWEADRFYRRLARADDATVAAVFCWERLSARDRMRKVSYASRPDLLSLTGARKMGAAG
jgi:(R,R)-butanediol dehydrogenase/meso-butanediol dehydrogenase/diacetyl reductase